MKLPITILNSDDERMGLSLNYIVPPILTGKTEGHWELAYCDMGSSISVKSKTLEEVVKKMQKKHKDYYGYELERAGKLLTIEFIKSS